MLGTQDHAQSLRQSVELGGELITNLLSMRQSLLRLYQLFQTEQFIALVVQSDASGGQFTTIPLTRRAQVAPTGLSEGLLMLTQISL